MTKKIIKYLTYFLILIFPLGLFLRFKLAVNVYLVPQDIVVCVLALFVLLYYLKKSQLPKSKVFFFFQLIFITIGLLSLGINYLFHKDINFIVSFLYVLRYVFYSSLAFVPDIFGFKSKLRSILLISGTIFLLVGYFQYFFYDNLVGLYYLGWDKHLYRMFSTFLDPNFAGVFYVIFFFFLLSQIFSKKIIDCYMELILSFFTLIAVYLTYSRTALVALLVGISLFLITQKKIKELIAAILVLVILLFAFSDFQIEGLNPFRTASTKDRIESYATVISIIQKNPIIGVGFDAYRYAQIRYGVRSKAGAALSNADAGTDSSLLFVMATSGIFGFIAFIYSYFVVSKDFITTNKLSYKIIGSMLIALIVSSFFLNILFYTPILIWIFLIISQRKKLLV